MQSPDLTRPRVALVLIAAMVLAPLGALICGLISFATMMAGWDHLPFRFLFYTPVDFPYPIRPERLLFTLLGLVVLAAVVLLITWLVTRAADRRRGFAAVLFGTWFAAIAGGWLATLATFPVMMIFYQYPAERIPLLLAGQVGAGGGWGLYWGWLTGLVCALIFTASNRKS